MQSNNKHIPMRKCIGCNTSKPKEKMIRITYNKAKEAYVIDHDIHSKSDGRGVYLCLDKECIEKAIKRKSFERHCHSKITDEELAKLMEALYEKQN